MAQIILFDLDGTLTDSAEGITKSVQYALEHFGIRESDPDKLKHFVGPPLHEEFMRSYHMPQRQADVAVAVYRERYARIGIYENKLYDGIEELLILLKKERKLLGVASSKPEIYVRKILEHFQIAEYFDVIVGSNMDGTRTAKAEVIEEALLRLGSSDRRDEILMVGDRDYDVEGALKCGIQCVGAGYGYGGIRELELAGAIYVAETVEELSILSDRSQSVQPDVQTEAAEMQQQGAVYEEMRVHQKDGMLRRIWRVLYPLGIHYLICFVVSQVGVMVLFNRYTMQDGSADYQALQEAVISHTLPLNAIAAAVALIPLELLRRRDSRRRGERSVCRRGATYAAVVVFAVTASQILNDLIAYSGLTELFPSYTNLQSRITEGQSVLVLTIAIGILAPLTEEVLFRGLIFKRLQDYLGGGRAVLLSGLLFGLYHGNIVQFIYASLLGFAFAMLMWRTNALSVVITAHVAANLWSLFGGPLLRAIGAANVALYSGVLAGFVVLALFTGVYLMGVPGKKRKEM